MEYSIRSYARGDREALYRICVKTAANGDDASTSYRDQRLLGHYYVGPYLAFQPELCFVLATDPTAASQRGSDVRGQCSGVVGYILGVSDSAAFNAYCEQHWFPSLRQRYGTPNDDDRSADGRMIRAIHRGHDFCRRDHYQAHLHIDLMPAARGRGHGGRLLKRFLSALAHRQVPGVALRVGIANTGAIGFYEYSGFRRVAENEQYVEMVLAL